MRISCETSRVEMRWCCCCTRVPTDRKRARNDWQNENFHKLESERARNCDRLILNKKEYKRRGTANRCTSQRGRDEIRKTPKKMSQLERNFYRWLHEVSWIIRIVEYIWQHRWMRVDTSAVIELITFPAFSSVGGSISALFLCDRALVSPFQRG